MEKPNVIVFDVDNTLIKGNLTFFFLKALVGEKFYFFRKCFVLIARGIYLCVLQLPLITKKMLVRKRNIYRLDKCICEAIKAFYQTFFKTFQKLDLLGKNLEKKATNIFGQNFFSRYVYAKGLLAIKDHLTDPNSIVVLLSGSPQELLDVLFNELCIQLDKENIDWKQRFFARGTMLTQGPTLMESFSPCIGSEKNRHLKALLKDNGYDDYTIQFIYSDNGFMADLPLFLEAKFGGALISKKTKLYKSLPKKFMELFVFLPSWEKS